MKQRQWLGVTAGVLLVGAGLMTVLQASPEKPVPNSAAPSVARDAAADDAVQRALRAGRPTVVEFGANACTQCRDMKPILEGLQRDHGARIAVVNVDLIKQKEINYIQRYRIQLMPTQIFFDAQGREIGRNLGVISASEILARMRVQVPSASGSTQ